MGQLTLDVSQFGVVMTADSQPVELVGGAYTVVPATGDRNRNPIVVRQAAGFSGLIGSVGTERIGGKAARDWLERFSNLHRDRPLDEFAEGLADALSDQWRGEGLRTILWIFLSGSSGGEVRFWYVNNTDGMNDDGNYYPATPKFKAVDDLDGNYIPDEINKGVGATKADVLAQRLFWFRNGAAMKPTAFVYDRFTTMLMDIYRLRIPGFALAQDIDGLAYFAKMRTEFTKRIYDPKYGIYAGREPALGGDVHVYAVAPDGEIRTYGKHVGQTKTVRHAFP